jgi:hypothetical protein
MTMAGFFGMPAKMRLRGQVGKRGAVLPGLCLFLLPFAVWLVLCQRGQTGSKCAKFTPSTPLPHLVV